jgi:SAM-dependent methyltransferase
MSQQTIATTSEQACLSEYRQGAIERARVDSLLGLLPAHLHHALDIGARDGHIARLLADRAGAVTALDLEQPQIDDPRIRCVKGDAAALEFGDGVFDLVFCAEVLEHIPGRLLPAACSELARVASDHVLVGVPYRQDLRTDRTTCQHCGRTNPPWGHVNSFDEAGLARLFPDCEVEKIEFVGATREGTNFLSALLMDAAGNPYGTYEQDEPCIHCGAELGGPPARNLGGRALARAAVYVRRLQQPFVQERPKWIHVLFRKRK